MRQLKTMYGIRSLRSARLRQLQLGSRSFTSTSFLKERKWSTPLAKQLSEAISTTGTVPLASYMRMCLTGDVGGYYTGAIQGRDQFGAKGDFVTSPEISQIFGELVAVWFIAEWINQGRPQNVQLIEIGPGRGTLMDDMLRTIARFPALKNNIKSVYMVETSKALQSAQESLLSKHEMPISWTESLKRVPNDSATVPFIVAHEFFDALPIHIFQSAPSSKPPKPTTATSPPQPTTPPMEWREMMISPVAPHSTSPTDFELTLSPSTTRHSRYLPESSPRYRALKSTPNSVIEICPDAVIYAADFATRIGGSEASPKPKPAGAALILDYGTSDTIPVNSLRGIKQHELVSPFTEAGLVDLSADVDFTALAEAATLASEGVEVHGPVTQADFLETMGIRERAEAVKQAGGSEELVDRVDKACGRLVDRGVNGMGKLYKVLAIVPENDGRRRPVGFGGDVSM